MRPETLELLSWVSREPRTYPEAIDVWRTHCPRHSVWDDAVADACCASFATGASRAWR